MRMARRPDAVGEKQDDRQPSEHDEDRRSAAGCDEKRCGERPLKARRKRGGRSPHQPLAGDQAARRDRAGSPAAFRSPHRAQRDQPECKRQHRLRHPRGDAGSDYGASLALAHHQLERADAEHRRHRGGNRGGKRIGPVTGATSRKERAGRQRQHRALARGERRAEKPDPEHQMLDERNGPANARAGEAAKQDFRERQDDHHAERDGREAIFEPMKPPDYWRATTRRLDRNGGRHLAIGRAFR
jgi:hypothetical protein